MAQKSRGLQNDKATNAESEWLPTYAAIICASNERVRLVDLANHYVSVLVTNWPAGFDTRAVRQLLGQDGSHFYTGIHSAIAYAARGAQIDVCLSLRRQPTHSHAALSAVTHSSATCRHVRRTTILAPGRPAGPYGGRRRRHRPHGPSRCRAASVHIRCTASRRARWRPHGS
jgi:hypothetical protein